MFLNLTFVASLLLVGASWAIAIPLGASNGVLGTLLVVLGPIPVIAHTKYLGPEHRRESENGR
jgi:hypothetical protein